MRVHHEERFLNVAGLTHYRCLERVPATSIPMQVLAGPSGDSSF